MDKCNENTQMKTPDSALIQGACSPVVKEYIFLRLSVVEVFNQRGLSKFKSS